MGGRPYKKAASNVLLNRYNLTRISAARARSIIQLLHDYPARLLMHDIAMEPQPESAVSFASLAIE
jgi:hypothetical protein